MAELTPGKLRGLSTASDEAGRFTILAIDHRDAMRVVLNPESPESVAHEEMTDTKLWLLDQLGSLPRIEIGDDRLQGGVHHVVGESQLFRP